jgi:pantoate--beta-alanine ligase
VSSPQVARTRVARTRVELAALRRTLPGRVATVMTLGALHAGHAALMQEARRRAESVIVTIFVNPLQFAPGEDLDRYPRTFDADLQVCAHEGVDLVFAPDAADVYPDGEPQVRVSAGRLGDRLEGAHRPGHFDGVLTVVAKLLHLTHPDVAIFGEKDGQQLALIRAMVRDLDIHVDIVGVATVRDPDGLALSSRNVYLEPVDRQAALALSAALAAARTAAAAGADAAEVHDAARRVLDAAPEVAVDYLELVDDETWGAPTPKTRAGRLLVAARVGNTRLIDNVCVSLGTPVIGTPSTRDAVG